MKPIYEPKGKAKEYGDYALNIYTGCPHRCYYCFAPNVLRREREVFHTDVRPRDNIVEETRKQLEREKITGKTIHLCFTCDPYPTGYDTTPTREIIKLLKDTGNHVQILTKGDGSRDFDLLDENDWYGITLDGGDYTPLDDGERYSSYHPAFRLGDMQYAKSCGIKTWCSFEPVVDAEAVMRYIRGYSEWMDKIKIGKLNYYPSDIDWASFGHEVEDLCKELGIDYYIKESLRKEMEKT